MAYPVRSVTYLLPCFQMLCVSLLPHRISSSFPHEPHLSALTLVPGNATRRGGAMLQGRTPDPEGSTDGLLSHPIWI